MMSDKEETEMGPVEKKIRSMMGSANDAILNITFVEKNKDADKIALKTCFNTLNYCTRDLARQIDKLAKSIK